MAESCEVLIIGGGPAGYAAALQAARKGFAVTLVEKEAIGGTCLNRGCIPTKALLSATEPLDRQEAWGEMGLRPQGGLFVDTDALRSFSSRCVEKLVGGVEFLLEKRKVRILRGEGRFAAPGLVTVAGADGIVTELAPERVLIATGSRSHALSIAAEDGERVVSSDRLVTVPSVPERLVIIGAGVIGLELGTLYRRLGSKVTFIEMLPGLFPFCDNDVAAHASAAFRKQGLVFNFKAALTEVQTAGPACKIIFKNAKGEDQFLEAEMVLVAVGRDPKSDGLGLEKAGIETNERGFVKTGEHWQTTAPGVYAAGDVRGGLMLAHKATHEALAVVSHWAGEAEPMEKPYIPNVVYTHPELAVVGLTESQAKAQGAARLKAGKFPFRANGRAITASDEEGLVKIIADPTTDEILGAQILGPSASELVHIISVAMSSGARLKDLRHVIFAHPTLSETVHEAILAAAGEPLHQL